MHFEELLPRKIVQKKLATRGIRSFVSLVARDRHDDFLLFST